VAVVHNGEYKPQVFWSVEMTSLLHPLWFDHPSNI